MDGERTKDDGADCQLNLHARLTAGWHTHIGKYSLCQQLTSLLPLARPPAPSPPAPSPSALVSIEAALVSLLCLASFPLAMSAALQAVKQFRMRELALLKVEPVAARPKVPNPFLPRKNPESGRWAPPKYSLRRQAELVKHARASGTLHLLPPGPKLSTQELAAKTASANVQTAASSSTAEVEADAESAVEARTEVAAEAQPEVAAETQTAPEWDAEVEWEGEMKVKAVKGAEIGARLYAGKKRMFKGHKWERTLEKRMKERKLLMKDMEQRIERFRTVSPGSLASSILFALCSPSRCGYSCARRSIRNLQCRSAFAFAAVNDMCADCSSLRTTGGRHQTLSATRVRSLTQNSPSNTVYSRITHNAHRNSYPLLQLRACVAHVRAPRWYAAMVGS